MAHVWSGVLREYADRLGVTDASTVVTLGEGGTPLLPAPAQRASVAHLMVLAILGAARRGSGPSSSRCAGCDSL